VAALSATWDILRLDVPLGTKYNLVGWPVLIAAGWRPKGKIFFAFCSLFCWDTATPIAKASRRQAPLVVRRGLWGRGSRYLFSAHIAFCRLVRAINRSAIPDCKKYISFLNFSIGHNDKKSASRHHRP
jgi:hypothetical protein